MPTSLTSRRTIVITAVIAVASGGVFGTVFGADVVCVTVTCKQIIGTSRQPNIDAIGLRTGTISVSATRLRENMLAVPCTDIARSGLKFIFCPSLLYIHQPNLIAVQWVLVGILQNIFD